MNRTLAALLMFSIVACSDTWIADESGSTGPSREPSPPPSRYDTDGQKGSDPNGSQDERLRRDSNRVSDFAADPDHESLPVEEDAPIVADELDFDCGDDSDPPGCLLRMTWRAACGAPVQVELGAFAKMIEARTLRISYNPADKSGRIDADSVTAVAPADWEFDSNAGVVTFTDNFCPAKGSRLSFTGLARS